MTVRPPSARLATRPCAARSAAGVLLACATLLAGCGEGGSGAGSSPSTSTSASAPSTPASSTSAGTATTSPSLPTKPGPDPSKTTPPPARDQAPPPADPLAYAQQFVVVWATGNTGRGELLATPEAHKKAFARTPGTTPTFAGCEGAAGSTVCTFTGDDYTMAVRVETQAASAGEAHAVTDVQFRT